MKDITKVVNTIFKITSMPFVRKIVNIFCLNKERIIKEKAVKAIVQDILAYYEEHNIKRKLIAEECRLMQKYYFKEQLKKRLNKKVAEEYKDKLQKLDSLESSEEIIEFLVEYYIDDMASDFDPAFLIIFKALIRFLFPHMYKSIKITEESKDAVKKIKSIQGKYPLFILPNHISNSDHIPICLALNKAGVFHPVIVAGANLYRGISRKILPKANCYKLRRDYLHGDVKWLSNPLYNMVFRKYNYYLWEHNEPFLFYIEGTRSRDGQILPPKLGFIKEILKFIEERDKVAYFVPVSLSYTVVPEDEELLKSIKGKNISNKDIVTQNLALDKIYGSMKDSSIYIHISEPVEISNENLPEAGDFAKEMIKMISENIVITPSYLFAHTVVSLKKENFTIEEIKNLLTKDSERIIEIGADIFEKKRAIKKIDNSRYEITNIELLQQYANRIKHFYVFD